MYSKLYVYGDSFVHGDTTPQDLTWANKLSKELNLEIYNRGVAGGSNKLSVINLLNDLSELSNYDDILIIFAFTSMHRTCFYIEDNDKWYNVIPNYQNKVKKLNLIEVNYYKLMHTTNDALYNLHAQKMFVQSILSQLKIQHFFINSFLERNIFVNGLERFNLLEKLIDKEKYLLGYENSIRDEVCFKYGLVADDGFHPSEDGHELAMNLIKNDLEKFL